jgi:EAL domain-containing protein (putative c-di-GMP-specific phosphodiesterase class I)
MRRVLAARAESADSEPMPSPATHQALAGALPQLLRRGGVRSLYQPIVELDSGLPVGYEALARGPQGSPLESPRELFGAAHALGLVAELDRACRSAAIEGALSARLQPPHALFVNVEPGAVLGDDAPLSHEDDLLAGRLRVVVELTERALTDRPAEVLAAVAWLRERGCGIALDDVGVDERSLALMPFLAPDVIKLDMSLIQARGASPAAARVLNAVAAEAERSGAVLLAEGIETEEHLARARAVGATLGQGWLFGRPARLPAGVPAAAVDRLPMRSHQPLPPGTPFELIADLRRVRRGDKRLLLALSRQLEAEASTLGAEAVVLAAFQDVKFFTPRSRERYEALARTAALVGAVGHGLGEEPAAGVRGAGLLADEPLQGEWDVAVIGPHFAGAFVARDLGDSGADGDRRFDFFVTYERELVVRAARALMTRIVPAA